METITYDKPFKTYDQLVDLIESRNIIVNDRERAKQALSQFSYYTLINGYKSSFLVHPNSDYFKTGVTFDDLYKLHIIASDFNNIILKYILHIENSLKTKLSYLISQKYGVYTNKDDFSNSDPNDYLYKRNYSSSTRKKYHVLNSIKECAVHARQNKSILHYTRHRNHIPPWILITNISFGLAIEWYSILKNTDKIELAYQFLPYSELSNEKIKEFFYKSLQLLREYRNKIAHGHKTIQEHVSTELPKLQLLLLASPLLSEEEYLNNLGKNDVFAVFIACAILLDKPDLLSLFFADLYQFFFPHKDFKIINKTIFSLLGLPDNFLERIEMVLSPKI